MFSDSILSFRKFCLKSQSLPPELHIKLSDIIRKAANMNDLFPFFLKHAFELYPHLNCMDELKQISDLTEPSYWYLEAREMKRKIIYHAGPTNSGKTYSALLGFQNSASGIYCGPLKLLANEVFIKTNNANTDCDLVTGEERKFADESGELSEHVACTVEMANLEKNYEVAVIDEIQMIKDPQRGWAWTRALLGLRAKEIHVCGDKSAVDLISDLSFLTGDEFKVRNYERLTPLNIQNVELGTLDNVQPGDCIVCFSKNDIYTVVSSLEKKGHEVAVIYGSMPPGVKLAQAARFNDPDDRCKLLVATDAIGMGLNLNIRRIVFYDLRKVCHYYF
jgi:ATP-dependent RNA helicase SUPV3L1/SUV3